MSAPATPGIQHEAVADRELLHELGYPQQLLRRMTPFAAFAVPFSNISILTGPVTLFGFALLTGGPAALVWTWVLLGPLVLCVAKALAEICSAYPTSGALYYWTQQLAKRHKRVASWTTAWLNALGQLAGTAAAAYSTALFIAAFAAITWGVAVTPRLVLAIFAGILVLSAGLNTLAVRLVAWLNGASVVVHVLGALIIAFALLALPAHHQSAGFVFTRTVNQTGFPTWYMWLLAPLTIMYTMTGLDAPGHLSEETERAARTSPKAVVRAVAWSWVLGLVVIVPLLLAVQDYSGQTQSAYGVAPAAIISDAVGGPVAKVLIGWIITAQVMCVMSCFTAMGRMFFACGRDNVFPFGAWLHTVNRRRVPAIAVWVSAGLAFLLGAPAYFSPVLFTAVTSVAAVALFTSYVIPVFLRLRRGREFTPGPYRLRAPRLVGGLAVGYVAVAGVLACLPTTRPVTRDTFNYTPVALVVTLAGVALWFATHGKHTYRGPRRFTEDEITQIEEAML